ncbi:Low molecular weight protein-tyrosine-phosphatase YfkJ [bioreactor metagenome]|jgi:protein-tyrosine phosphatase|uniref:protein-tyrosine-phosphatase n=1 Tax=bioreactor metagenome TaxID=1076179 RepID=A0A645IXP1_9ZZZZ|nr:low molecular weight protein-tyrosine-phosphatase [Azonexus sp.]
MNFRVLLVCMGNICRSPTAEAVLRHYIRNHRLGDKVEVDSAGTHGYHVGEAPDARTQRAARARGYDLSQLRARKVARQDLDYFDLILAMDRTNLDNLQRMASLEQQGKIRLFMDYAKNFEDDEVPDPYYGLGYGFDLVLDMVEDGAQGIVDELLSRLR